MEMSLVQRDNCLHLDFGDSLSVFRSFQMPPNLTEDQVKVIFIINSYIQGAVIEVLECINNNDWNVKIVNM